MNPKKGELVFFPQIMEDYAPIKHETDKSYLFFLEEGKKQGFWAAKKIITWSTTERGYEGQVPEWFVDKVEIQTNIVDYER